MATHATLCPPRNQVHRRKGSADLPPLRLASFDLMALAAIQLLFTMLGVTEVDLKGLRHHRRAAVGPQTVTGAAGRDVAASGLRTRSVALVTGVVGRRSRGDRQGDVAASGRLVADRTAGAFMFGVVEFHIETCEFRKRLHIRRTGGLPAVADRANRTAVAGELFDMAAGTGRVAGAFRLYSGGLAAMAEQARQARVRRLAVREF